MNPHSQRISFAILITLLRRTMTTECTLARPWRKHDPDLDADPALRRARGRRRRGTPRAAAAGTPGPAAPGLPRAQPAPGRHPGPAGRRAVARAAAGVGRRSGIRPALEEP